MLTLESAETPREFTLQPLLRGDCGGVRFSPRRGFFFGVSRVAIRESDCLFESGNVSRASARRSINVFFGAYRGDAGFTRRRTSFAHLVAFRACVSSGGNCCPRADCNLTRGCFKYLQRRGASWVRDHKHTRGYGSVRAESARATRTSQPDRHGCLYFVDKAGDVACVKRGSKSMRKVERTGIKKVKGYLYFVDTDGDVSRAKMARG